MRKIPLQREAPCLGERSRDRPVPQGRDRPRQRPEAPVQPSWGPTAALCYGRSPHRRQWRQPAWPCLNESHERVTQSSPRQWLPLRRRGLPALSSGGALGERLSGRRALPALCRQGQSGLEGSQLLRSLGATRAQGLRASQKEEAVESAVERTVRSHSWGRSAQAPASLGCWGPGLGHLCAQGLLYRTK